MTAQENDICQNNQCNLHQQLCRTKEKEPITFYYINLKQQLEILIKGIKRTTYIFGKSKEDTDTERKRERERGRGREGEGGEGEEEGGRERRGRGRGRVHASVLTS